MKIVDASTSFDELELDKYYIKIFKRHFKIETIGEFINISIREMAIGEKRLRPILIFEFLFYLKNLGFTVKDYGVEYIEESLRNNITPVILDFEIIGQISNKYFIADSGTFKNIKRAFAYFHRFTMEYKIEEKLEGVQSIDQLNSENFFRDIEYLDKLLRNKYTRIMREKKKLAEIEVQKKPEKEIKPGTELKQAIAIKKKSLEKAFKNKMDGEQLRFHHRPFEDELIL